MVAVVASEVRVQSRELVFAHFTGQVSAHFMFSPNYGDLVGIIHACAFARFPSRLPRLRSAPLQGNPATVAGTDGSGT